MKEKTSSIFQKEILLQAFKGSFTRLNPITLLRNPVMLIVEIGAVITTIITIIYIFTGARLPVQPPDHNLALVHGPFRKLRRSHSRKPGKSPG